MTHDSFGYLICSLLYKQSGAVIGKSVGQSEAVGGAGCSSFRGTIAPLARAKPVARSQPFCQASTAAPFLLTVHNAELGVTMD